MKNDLKNRDIKFAKLQLIVNFVDQLSRQGLKSCDEIDETVDKIFYYIENFNPEKQQVILK